MITKRLHIVACILLVLVSIRGFAQKRSITDMAGRKVMVPQKINRILPHDDKTSIFLFSCVSNKLIGRGLNPDRPDMKYISEAYRKLPVIDIKSTEEVIKSNPDVIIAGCFIPEDYYRYDQLSRTTNIPVILIDLNLMKLNRSYLFLDSLFGKTADGKTCSNYLTAFYSRLELVLKSKKPTGSAYLAVGKEGLQTAPQGSKHTQVFDFMNIKNAAETEIQARGYATVSIEQIMLWKPDFVFTIDKGGNDPITSISTSPLWRNIPAVQKKQLIHVPEEPYNWFGNPPSINRIPGLILLSELFYKYPQKKANQQIKEFYKIFYKYNLTDAELAGLRQYPSK